MDIEDRLREVYRQLLEILSLDSVEFDLPVEAAQNLDDAQYHVGYALMLVEGV